jgi:formylglycine-generating enzyme required for sulfatase activity
MSKPFAATSSFVAWSMAAAVCAPALGDGPLYDILEFAPNSSVVTAAALRTAISGTALPWRVRDRSSGIEMVLIPPGSFVMGASPGDPDAANNEFPTRVVTLTQAIYVTRTEITQAAWIAVMGSNPSQFTGVMNRPVEKVSWNQAQSWCVSSGMRLLTEAEWEFGCRAGTTTSRYSSDIDAIAWWGYGDGNASAMTHPVGTRLPNDLGLFDTLGNVNEWVQDVYGVYPAGDETDPLGPVAGERRVSRGGGFDAYPRHLRASLRWDSLPTMIEANTGFRAARTASRAHFADTDGDGVFDEIDNCVGTPNPSQADCDGDGVGDVCELVDCNGNGIPDSCDINLGLSRDIDQDGVPDECSLDCNANGRPDAYDIATSTSADCNANSIPDECEDGSVTATTGAMGRFGNGVTASGTLHGLVMSATPVSVTVRARGDLGTSTEFAVVKFAGVTIANFFVAGGGDCSDTADSETIQLSAANWNAFLGNSPGGTLAVSVAGSPLVDASQCIDSFVEVSVRYKSGRYDCNGDGISDLCQIASGSLADCNQNGFGDACEILSGEASDIDGNGVPDSCQTDCNTNGLPDSFEIDQGLVGDCNSNGAPDSCDIGSGSSADLDANGVPDSCQPDCDGNGKPDDWEISTGRAPDCDGNSVLDVCDIAAGSADIDANGQLDSCQGDCDGNGRPDSWEILLGAQDDDQDGRLDVCEFAYGDLDLDGEVTSGDIAFMLLIFGETDLPFGDLDGDGVISSGDISIMLLNFGTVPF